MKIIFYFVISVLSVFTYAQPNFVIALSNDGPQFGGTLFRLDLPANSTSMIHSFNNLDPHRAESGLTIGEDDWLYGTLRFNGSDNHGALYKIKRDGTGFTIVYHMQNSFGPTTRPYFHTDGKIYFSDENELLSYDPSSNAVNAFGTVPSTFVRNLSIDTDDWIYFTTSFGSLEKIKTDGTGETMLRNFNQHPDGYNGVAGVTEIPGDSLVGTLTAGGSHDGGIIYSIRKDGTEFTVLHEFEDDPGMDLEGSSPESKLVLYDGRLFGTTSRGGSYEFGVVYEINPDGTGFHVIADIPTGFTGRGDQSTGDIGITSDARIIGAFYQFAHFSDGDQRFFSVDTSGLNFHGFGNVNQYESGHFNNSPLILDDETIAFTTQSMGRHDGGTFSEVSSSMSTFGLFHFGASVNGFRPGELIKGSDGRLFGLTRFGGPGGNGIIYSIMPNGTGYTKLHEFDDTQGYDPRGKLLEGSDGKLYGATTWGGPHGSGCLFRIDKNGNNFQVLYDFANFDNGYSPTGSLVEDASGALFGTTEYSTFGYGVLFKINKDGTGYTVLKNFVPPDPALTYAGLQLSAGYLYGAGYLGGSFGNGGLFRMHTDGTGYEVLHSFSQSIDGSNPFGPPIVSSSGKLYGITSFGGSSGMGTIYSLDISGTNFQLLRNIGPADVQSAQQPIILSSDGKLYGTGFTGGGTAVYQLNTNGTNYNILKTFDALAEGQVGTSLIEINSVSLPVRLTKFQAQKRNATALLTWETAQEQNSKSFEIEKSAHGNSFTKVGTVSAKGNSNMPTAYSFTDENPDKGINYYRLKQIDKDEHFSYSPVKSLFFNNEQAISIYPNPSTDRIQIKLHDRYAHAEVEISNSDGKLMKQFSISNADELEIPVAAFAPGRYQIRLISKDKVQIASFIKQNR
jgi:uncharacterized repeat protein (TIGR03803 family)